MPKLVLVEEGGARDGTEYTLEAGELTLGREETSTVRYQQGEGGVSRKHALLQASGDGFFLADRGSANGTFLNGQRVEASAWVKDGDLVELGQGGPRLRVRLPGAAPAPPAAPPRAVQPPPPRPVLVAPPTAPSAPPAPEVAPGGTARLRLTDRTMFDPARHPAQPRNALGVVVIMLMAAAGIGMGMLVGLMSLFELGLGVALVGVTVAFAPAPLYLAIWLWLDRYDPEPGWALAGALVWGAGAATFVSAIINTVVGQIAQGVTGSQAAAEFLSASISAPLVEEAAKGTAVLLIFLVLRREFDGVLDGIVYAGVVALGFAAVENVLYYGRSLAKGGAGSLIVVFILRGVMGPFAHAVFTSMTGIGCGLARESHNKAVRVLAPIGGYMGAVFLHFLWNTLAGFTDGLGGYLLLYIFIWVPLFLVFFSVVIWMGFRESRLLRRMLEPEVALGLITREQADMVGSWPRRVGWLLGALPDFTRLGARRRFLHAVTRLAFSYWHMERASDAGGLTLSAGLAPGYRGEVAKLKTAV